MALIKSFKAHADCFPRTLNQQLSTSRFLSDWGWSLLSTELLLTRGAEHCDPAGFWSPATRDLQHWSQACEHSATARIKGCWDPVSSPVGPAQGGTRADTPSSSHARIQTQGTLSIMASALWFVSFMLSVLTFQSLLPSLSSSWADLLQDNWECSQ